MSQKETKKSGDMRVPAGSHLLRGYNNGKPPAHLVGKPLTLPPRPPAPPKR